MKKPMVVLAAACLALFGGAALATKKRQDGESGGRVGGGGGGRYTEGIDKGRAAGEARNRATTARETIPRPQKQKEPDPYKKDR